jgi:hypothetical protein
MWLLTNKPSSALQKLNTDHSFCLYTDQDIYIDKLSELIILIEGYVLPRDGISIRLPVQEMIQKLYLEHGKDFIHKVKGNFTILIVDKEKFFLFSDRFAIKKFFYWQTEKDFIISNDLHAISSTIDARLSKENMAVYALTHHYIGGITIYENIYHNIPAELIFFSNGSLNREIYWNPENLIENNKEYTPPKKLAKKLQEIVISYLNYDSAGKVSHSLTAGVDSRLLFSILKNRENNLHTYTYGNPASLDAVMAKKIADDSHIAHDVHDITFNAETFAESVEESILTGQTLCSLHRAHRYKAIQQEAVFGELMFLGTMGGEFIKGANHDDYIMADFIYEFSNKQDEITLLKYLNKKFINFESVDMNALLKFFQSQAWCKNPELVDLYGLIEIAASLHHGQNDMHFSKFFNHVFIPYTDIDYLETLFRSDYNFLSKKKYNSKFRQRLENHRFGAELQKILAPELINYPYNSGFIASEYLKYPLLAAIKSRIRKKIWKYPANFPLTGFMQEFVNNQLLQIEKKGNVINEVFDIDELLSQSRSNDHGTSESYWLKYTTPIQLSMTVELFK